MPAAPQYTAPALVWFRDDLRLSDNPALVAAANAGHPLIAVYVLDDESRGLRKLGGAARWFLHGALAALDDALVAQGGRLLLLRGAAETVIRDCVAASGASAIFWNGRYEAAGRAIDTAIETALKGAGTGVTSFDGALLFPPAIFAAKKGGFQVFSAFWRHALAQAAPGEPLRPPRRLAFAPIPDALNEKSVTLAALALTPTKPDWAAGLRASWTPSDAGAKAALKQFLAKTLSLYARNRDRPDIPSTSCFSPHLRFGTLSPRTLWHAVAAAKDASKEARDKFRYELGWREFSYHLLLQHPEMARRNLRDGFDHIQWRDDRGALRAWQRGQTGYPIVDAGMRQLWQMGWMHNRVRMIAASFLIKHLLIDWREGEAWFWDTLVDADAANNPQNWQWVAGTGADASPFFRIFNPILQAKKFDPNGDYVRRYVPELAGLPVDRIHEPWTANAMELGLAGVTLGETYPHRIVDHEAARKRALDAWKARGV